MSTASGFEDVGREFEIGGTEDIDEETQVAILSSTERYCVVFQPLEESSDAETR
ncbi:hypothetical protein [Natrarchaeobaculum sulfurireducens]|uniref:Uncharacterized protein n=1 Tax=Natrarchaeobaculum sulfurireducens TaxID=2044521 RepID=A0A346PQ60_9EURY|nr:hypothetical protein [Natrarchaeobaculum sulfurireducens]AXR78314.1 hypothetical protein AArc1_1995 [Natrarchaeobaculum sulfurireducens]AXR81655.1 hypothetical protein AArcMg_1644 [Natrarchaeobaculum sulfurireducens]